jgi:hypothetical protein
VPVVATVRLEANAAIATTVLVPFSAKLNAYGATGVLLIAQGERPARGARPSRAYGTKAGRGIPGILAAAPLLGSFELSTANLVHLGDAPGTRSGASCSLWEGLTRWIGKREEGAACSRG